MLITTFVLAWVVSSVAALPSNPHNALRPRAAAPTVIIANGTVVGSTSNGVDSFKGIPFAQPPTGTKRLRPPTPLATGFGTLTATATPSSCPQMGTVGPSTDGIPTEAVNQITELPIVQAAEGDSEDCLTLNVQRPSNASINSASKLPVVFWIYGGGFESGSTSMYDGSNLIQKSIQLNAPVLYVAPNYRLSAFGFLAGKELQADGSTNLGLRDQRLALQWVADNIAAFGGDPGRVTIWGESAGSISVYDQLLINGGDNTYKGKPLFIGAMMDSGSAVPTTDVASAKPQAVYDGVVAAAGCQAASDTLECLRSLSYEKFLDASNSQPGIFSYRSLDLSYLPRYDPHDNFFRQSPGISGSSTAPTAKVPIILGDQEDEGTLFSLVLSNVTTTDDLVTYLLSYFPNANRAQIQGLVDTYPTDPSAGSPFRTGDLNELYPQYKRIAAILGDLTFTLTRRAVLNSLQQVDPNLPLWSYLGSYDYGLPFLGTLHGSDILEIYYNLPFPEPASTILTYYVSFINHQNPNTLGTAAPLINWPQWQSKNPQLLNFLEATNQLIPDTFRSNNYKYIESIQSVLVV